LCPLLPQIPSQHPAACRVPPPWPQGRYAPLCELCFPLQLPSTNPSVGPLEQPHYLWAALRHVEPPPFLLFNMATEYPSGIKLHHTFSECPKWNPLVLQCSDYTSALDYIQTSHTCFPHHSPVPASLSRRDPKCLHCRVHALLSRPGLVSSIDQNLFSLQLSTILDRYLVFFHHSLCQGSLFALAHPSFPLSVGCSSDASDLV
jgi:hypothetical protein